MFHKGKCKVSKHLETYIQLSMNRHSNRSPEPTNKDQSVSKRFIKENAKFQSIPRLTFSHPRIVVQIETRTYKQKSKH